MPQAKPVRFPRGLSTAPSYAPLGWYPRPSPFHTHQYDNDFDTYNAADWTLAATTGTTALTAGNGGLVIQTTAATAADIQHNLKNPAAFATQAGQGLWFMWRGQVSSVTDQLAIMGLQAGGTAFAPVDGIFFTKAAAATAFVLNIRAAGVSTTLTLPGLVIAAATNYALAFYYDGDRSVTAWGGQITNPGTINSVALSYLGTIGTMTLTNLPTVNLGVSFGTQNGASVLRTMTTDYIMAANEIVR